jgi:hypothetical protein
MRVAERAAGKAVSRRAERTLAVLSALAVAATLVMALFVTPPDAVQGQVFRLIYVHVPSAWLAYLSFAVVFVASIAYLRTKKTRWDRLAAASAEVGVVFTALTLILGSIWAKPVWGTWWTWDPRLTTTAVLLLIYLGYLAVRRLSDDPRRRATWSAVVGIVGFVDVPIVHLSVVWLAASGPRRRADRPSDGADHGLDAAPGRGGVHDALRVHGRRPAAGGPPRGAGRRRSAEPSDRGAGGRGGGGRGSRG